MAKGKGGKAAAEDVSTTTIIIFNQTITNLYLNLRFKITVTI